MNPARAALRVVHTREGHRADLTGDACGSASPHPHIAALPTVTAEGGVFGCFTDSATLITKLEPATEAAP